MSEISTADLKTDEDSEEMTRPMEISRDMTAGSVPGDGQPCFDREITFEEVFYTSEGSEFVDWIYGLAGCEMLMLSRTGSVIAAPRTSKSVLRLPRPASSSLPEKPMRFKGTNGSSSVGMPVRYEGDTFMLLLVDDAILNEKSLVKKLKHTANMLEWYIHVAHKRRMIYELHDHTQAMSYQELLSEHERVLESEAKYRELSETLEQRVKERKKELEKAQAQLLQQEKMASVGQLAAGIAHEINNPTGFVKSNLSSLQRYHKIMMPLLNMGKKIIQKSESPEARVFMAKWNDGKVDFILGDLPALVSQSLKGTERITKIVRSLSRFSHVDEQELKRININDLLNSTVEMLWNEIKYKATLEKEYGDIPIILGNSNQLSQVLVNIIMNALQAIQKEGAITLTTRTLDGFVEIRIKDTGCGISEENISQVMNPFFTTKPVGKGTGLGLSISYEIITAHHGDMRVESQPGRGTTFFITLPIERNEKGGADSGPQRSVR